MALKFNIFTGIFDEDSSSQIRTVSSDPGSGFPGQLILNTTDDKIKVYYSNTWQELHTLSAATPLQGEPMGLLLTLTYANDV